MPRDAGEIYKPTPEQLSETMAFAEALHSVCRMKIHLGTDPNFVMNAVGQVLTSMCIDFKVDIAVMQAAIPIWHDDMIRAKNAVESKKRRACN